MIDPANFKYGLKNASAFLHKLRREKQTLHNFSHDTVNQKQRTFEQQYIPSSKESPQQEVVQKNISQDLNPKSLKRKAIQQNEKQHQVAQKGVKLVDLVIKQHLKKTLDVYKKDLQQMQQNRDNLIDAIQQVAIKIKSLNDLQRKNQSFQLQNSKGKRQLNYLVKDYHELKLKLQKRKIKMKQNFIKKKQKIKALLDLYQPQNQYVVESQSWNFYFRELYQNKNKSFQSLPQKKINQIIFPKTQNQGQNQKKKDKNKVVDKSGLLGDLKNFAKNFKMPSGNSNQT